MRSFALIGRNWLQIKAVIIWGPTMSHLGGWSTFSRSEFFRKRSDQINVAVGNIWVLMIFEFALPPPVNNDCYFTIQIFWHWTYLLWFYTDCWSVLHLRYVMLRGRPLIILGARHGEKNKKLSTFGPGPPGLYPVTLFLSLASPNNLEKMIFMWVNCHCNSLYYLLLIWPNINHKS